MVKSDAWRETEEAETPPVEFSDWEVEMIDLLEDALRALRDGRWGKSDLRDLIHEAEAISQDEL